MLMAETKLSFDPAAADQRIESRLVIKPDAAGVQCLENTNLA